MTSAGRPTAPVVTAAPLVDDAAGGAETRSLRDWLALDWRSWVRVLGLTAATLLSLSLVVTMLQQVGIERFSYTLDQIALHFDVDREDSVPTWFSAVILGVAATQLLVIGRLHRAQRDRWRLYWTGLGVIFVLLSIDEIAGFHNTQLVSDQTARGMSDFFAIPWVLQGMVVVALFAFAYLRFLFALPDSTKWGLVTAGFVYVGGALIMEMIGAYSIVHLGFRHPVTRGIITLEEGMEMSGVIILIATLFRYIESEFPRIRAVLESPPHGAATTGDGRGASGIAA